ncbi:hypothetical protein CONCODRAFT_13565 [Conidiobolus coronatus NRRL 28638]|uniref:C2H2-type domain-containing protein n=1 Tax=Conidiobolus coronatus (strain ATCC 28846 / CBS 209.66 / NRRL 28638) TaxID=796925 RepID=A0A137NQG5_CONC2|nr:hypothetical protein CONCODRAFT_13565 [Conidiobolus coronatus NRRL 28638]|eukprot:KXN65005.1 hypothetical protein CONCODRAFT_13565 [Conidiobolus coronatus NRRL 28638]
MSNAHSSIWSTPAAPQYGFHDFHTSDSHPHSRQQYFSTFSPQLGQRSLPNSTPDLSNYVEQSPQLYQGSIYTLPNYGYAPTGGSHDNCLKKSKSSASPPTLRTNSADTYFLSQYAQELPQSTANAYEPYISGQAYYAQSFIDSHPLMNIVSNSSQVDQYSVSSPTLDYAPMILPSNLTTEIKQSKYSPLFSSSTSLDCSLPSPNIKHIPPKQLGQPTRKPRRAPKNPQAAYIVPGPSGMYECAQCPQKFRRKFCYQRHLLMHSEDRLFQCSACQMNFYRKDIFERHRKTKKCLRAQMRE